MTNSQVPDQATLRAMEQRLITTIRYVESVEDFPSGPLIREVIMEAARKGDLRSLRLLDREIQRVLVALTPFQRAELNKLLQDPAE